MSKTLHELGTRDCHMMTRCVWVRDLQAAVENSRDWQRRFEEAEGWISEQTAQLQQARREGWEQCKRGAVKQCEAIANTCDMESSYSRGCFSTADQLEFDIAAMEYKDSDLCK